MCLQLVFINGRMSKSIDFLSSILNKGLLTLQVASHLILRDAVVNLEQEELVWDDPHLLQG